MASYNVVFYILLCACASKSASIEDMEDTAMEERPGRWMLLPGGGDGRVQVAVLEGVNPRQAPDPDTVSFLLWTRTNPRSAERLRLSGSCAAQNQSFRRFEPGRPSIVLVHGFGDSARYSYMYPTLRDAFLETGDFNVLAVDWAALAAAPWYASAAANTVRAARRLGKLLASLEGAGADLRRFHLLGFSLGAHVAGLAAAHAKQLGAGRVGRITGLDPAQVLLSAAGPTRRLDRSHASRVDVIHTSGGYLAFLSPLGHRDFFPNGGAWPQPGCKLDFSGVCSHRRAYYYYAESLRQPDAFGARPCASWDAFQQGNCSSSDESALPLTALATDADADAGDEQAANAIDTQTPVFYFLDTNPQPPFGRPPPPPKGAGGPFGPFLSPLGVS